MKSLTKLKAELRHANRALRKPAYAAIAPCITDLVRDTLRFALDESDVAPVHHVLALANFSDGLKKPKAKKLVSKKVKQSTTAWLDRLGRGKSLVAELDALQRDIAEYRDRAAAEIATALQHGGAVVNADAVRAVVKRPYEIIPINEREARLIQFKGIDAPIVGWVEKDTPAFRICRVTRLMNVVEALPDWVNTTLGWRAPDHQALIDSTREAVRVTSGDTESFRRKYGAHLANDLGNGSFKIKRGDAWIKLVASLINDGIMPYAPSPVAPEHWDASAKSPIKMRDYQAPVITEFLREGALTINHPAGAGKRFVGLFILAHFRGRVLIAIDSDAGREQWQDSLKDFPPHKDARVTVSTLQGIGKYLKDEWDLVIMDEAQRIPANNFSRLAFVSTKYRVGMTSTAWREDKRESLIFALCGRPAHISWSSLIHAGVLRRPSITVIVVKNDAAKTARVKSLVAQRKGQTLIYCDWIAQGQKLANLLGVPFIHGETPKKLAALREAEVAVVSRVADRAIDLPESRTVIEVAGQGKSREQLGQRVGRLLHGIENGEFYVLFTAEEFSKFRPRLFGIEAELAGEVDIALLDERSHATHVT